MTQNAKSVILYVVSASAFGLLILTADYVEKREIPGLLAVPCAG